jgi:hypothetical protein
MAINRASEKKQLQDGLNTVFGLAYKQYPLLFLDFCNTETESRKAYIEAVLMSGFGGAAVKEEGAGVTYDTASEGYVARAVFETVALAFAITEEAQEDNLYMDLGKTLAKELAKSHAYTKNVKGANLLNYGFTTTGPAGTSSAGGDGVALLASNHPLKSGGTASNILSTAADLTETSLEDLVILVGGMTNDRGLPAMLTQKKLIVPNELQFVAKKIQQTQLQVDTANNTKNIVGGMLPGGVSVNRFLTDTDAFFLTTDCDEGLTYTERMKLSQKMEGEFESGNLRYKSRERYVFWFKDWRTVIGTPGA